MTDPHKLRILWLIVSAPFLVLTFPFDADAGGPEAPLRSKAGLYVRLDAGSKGDEKKLYQGSPLVDAVVLMVRWRSIEPNKGQFHLEPLKEEVAQWGRAGKGVVLSLKPYGQTFDSRRQTADGSHYVMETPPWVYEDTATSVIEFVGGGGSRGQKIALPKVWEENFVEAEMEPAVHALARAFDGDPHVWYIRPGLGHIGHMTAQASPGGSRAFLNAGWTPQAWGRYCQRVFDVYRKHFRKTPLLLIAEKRLLSNRSRLHYMPEEAVMLKEFASQGVTIVHLGLVNDLAGIRPIYSDLQGVIPLANRGTVRLGIGDDWPLWVPVSRREQKVTRMHDEEFLRQTLRFAFGGSDDLPKIPTTILYLQPPEMMVTNPQSPRNDELAYNPAVYDILNKARRQLLANDAMLFGH
jgi:hypothetical protein